MTDYNIDFGLWGRIFPVPCAVADQHLKFCTGDQLKVLLLALREGTSPVDLEQIAKRLGMAPEKAADCLDYWREAGLFSQGESPAPQKEATPAVPAAESPRTPGPESAPAAPASPSPAPLREERTVGEQKIVTLHSRGKLTPSQQNQLIREDPEIPQLLETLQEVLSRPLTPYETEGFLYLYNGLRLSSSYLLLAAQYSREQGKDSIRQIERLVTGWVEKGIDTYDDAETEIKRLARRQGNEGKIRELFGIRDRNLSAKEKDYIEHWFTDLGYGEEIIKLAYDRTVDNTGKAAFPYLNRILNRWQEKGVRTPEEAMAEMESGSKAQRGKPGQQTAAPESSFDLSEIRRLMEENSGG
jgi:DnaD/phage-associated family protein